MTTLDYPPSTSWHSVSYGVPAQHTYNFIVVGTTLYKVNPYTGEAWYTSHGQWWKVNDPKQQEQEEGAE